MMTGRELRKVLFVRAGGGDPLRLVDLEWCGWKNGARR